MGAIQFHDTIGRMVAERPARSRVFEKWGIDYCCGGKKSLEDACIEKALDVEAIVHDLQDSDERAGSGDQNDWTTAPLNLLADHIVATHHAYLREALPRLTFLTEKVRDAHGVRHPELIEVAQTFAAFRAEMESHAAKEEQVLFPYIKQLAASETLPPFQCGSVVNAIERMETEHEEAGAALEQMRALTQDYIPPTGACNTYRAMLDALAELEEETHRHVHKENSILFPRAAAREAELAAQQ